MEDEQNNSNSSRATFSKNEKITENKTQFSVQKFPFTTYTLVDHPHVHSHPRQYYDIFPLQLDYSHDHLRLVSDKSMTYSRDGSLFGRGTDRSVYVRAGILAKHYRFTHDSNMREPVLIETT